MAGTSLEGGPARPRRRPFSGVSVVGLLVGAALLVGSVWWAQDVLRIYARPTARVHVQCEIRDDPCPATWTAHGRTVHGWADDPYPDHGDGRLTLRTGDTVMTLHVSGTRASKAPTAWSVLGFVGAFLMGLQALSTGLGGRLWNSGPLVRLRYARRRRHQDAHPPEGRHARTY